MIQFSQDDQRYYHPTDLRVGQVLATGPVIGASGTARARDQPGETQANRRLPVLGLNRDVASDGARGG